MKCQQGGGEADVAVEFAPAVHSPQITSLCLLKIREIRGSTLPFLPCLFPFVFLVCFVVQISWTHLKLAG